MLLIRLLFAFPQQIFWIFTKFHSSNFLSNSWSSEADLYSPLWKLGPWAWTPQIPVPSFSISTFISPSSLLRWGVLCFFQGKPISPCSDPFSSCFIWDFVSSVFLFLLSFPVNAPWPPFYSLALCFSILAVHYCHWGYLLNWYLDSIPRDCDFISLGKTRHWSFLKAPKVILTVARIENYCSSYCLVIFFLFFSKKFLKSCLCLLCYLSLVFYLL